MAVIKHTPGPWQMHDEEYCPEEIWGNLEGPIEGQVRGTEICTVNQDSPDFLANARLISIAPTLLAVLRKIRDVRDFYAEHNQYPDATVATCFDDWAADLADSAIAKMEGR